MFVIVEQNAMWPFGTPGLNVLSIRESGKSKGISNCRMRINLGYVLGCLATTVPGKSLDSLHPFSEKQPTTAPLLQFFET